MTEICCKGFLICLLKMMKKRISWSSCQREKMRNHTKISQKRKLTLLPKMQKNCVLFIKNILAESNFIISIRTEKRLLTDCQEQQIRLLFIRQMRLLLWMEVISKQEHIMVRWSTDAMKAQFVMLRKNMQNSLVHTILCWRMSGRIILIVIVSSWNWLAL